MRDVNVSYSADGITLVFTHDNEINTLVLPIKKAVAFSSKLEKAIKDFENLNIKVCNKCNGRKQIQVLDEDSGIERTIRCPICGGKGFRQRG